MTDRTARIKLGLPRDSSVVIDGHDLSNAVASLHIDASHSTLPRLVLDLVLHETELDGKVTTEVPPKTHAALVALGWTPPNGPPTKQMAVHELRPDDVVLIGNVTALTSTPPEALRQLHANLSNQFTGRKVILFAEDIDVQAARDLSDGALAERVRQLAIQWQAKAPTVPVWDGNERARLTDCADQLLALLDGSPADGTTTA